MAEMTEVTYREGSDPKTVMVEGGMSTWQVPEGGPMLFGTLIVAHSAFIAAKVVDK